MFMYVAHLFLIFQPLSVGTFVLLRHQDGRKGCKLTKRWNGPYKIVESLGKGVYKIFNLKTRKVVKKAVNICKLKLVNSGEQKKSLHFSDNSIFQTCSQETFLHMNYPMFPIKIQFHIDHARPSKGP